MAMAKVGSPGAPDAFCGVSEVTLARAAKITCAGGPSCATPPMCGKLYNISEDSVVDMGMLAPCPTLLESHHGLGMLKDTSALTPAQIEEERQRRRKHLESLREKRLLEDNAHKEQERRRQERRASSLREQLDRDREQLDRQHRTEAAFCPCFVA